MIVCPEIKQNQPQDRKIIFETLSLPVARSCRLSRDRRQLSSPMDEQFLLNFQVVGPFPRFPGKTDKQGKNVASLGEGGFSVQS